MPTTTPIHGLQVMSSGDKPNTAADILTFADDIDNLLPVSSATQPSPLAGLIWFNPATGVASISDGTSWYPISISATAKVSGTTATVTSTTTEVPITNWNTPTTWLIGGISYASGVFTVSIPGVYRAGLTVTWPSGTAGYRNTQNFLVNAAVVSDGAASYNTASGVGAQSLVSSAEFQLAAGGTVQAGLISTTGGVAGVQPICFSLTRVA